VNAVYAQVEGEVIPLVRASVGVRYEDAEQSVVPVELFGGTPAIAPEPLENQYLLPAATVTWNFAENMQLRLGASKTIARPQFRELAPQQYLDPDTDRLFVGNPFLQDTELVNLDARAEWYFARGQFLTGGVFYKDLQNPIEATVNEAGATIQQTYLNAPKAVVYGLELEGKKYFDFDTGMNWIDQKRWLVQANYTYSKAEVQVEEGDVVFPLAGAGVARPALNYIQDGSRLQGQSEHLANLQLGWEDDTAGSQATLLVTYVSERTTARGRPGEPDLINDPGVLLDIVVRQRLLRRWGGELTLGLEARNLLDENYEEYQELGGGRVDLNTYDLGRSFSASLTARF
jgi:TonB-dependent receptor